MLYGSVIFGLALAVLALAYALVSQPASAALERQRADTAEARTVVLETQVARLRPTAAACRVPPYYTPNC